MDLFDRGDFYRLNGEAVNLSRWTGAIAVQFSTENDAAMLEALTSIDGPLTGFSVLRSLGQHEWILTCPTSAEVGPNLAINLDGDARITAVESTPGVDWVTTLFVNPKTNSWMAATDEVTVALHDGGQAAEFFANDSRFTSWRPLAGTPDQFIATLTNGVGSAALAMSEELFGDARVAWAEPNFWQDWRQFFTPNDSLYSQQWHLNQGNDADIDAPEAWDKLAGGSSSIAIAIVDDGIELTHPDLAANIFKNAGEIAANGKDDDGNGWIDDINGWDFVFNDSNPGPDSVNDVHGTATAGVAAAVGNNGLGVTGAAYNSKILPARIFNGGSSTSDGNIASAIYYSAGRTASGLGQWNAANITSNSWGGGSLTQTMTNAFTWASNTAKSGKGVPSFIATGNGGGAVSSPAILSATVPGVIAVGSSTNGDVWANYSGFGSQINLVAPSNGGSLSITTTDRTGGTGYSGTDYTNGFGGTSSATPLAAGVGALILAQDSMMTAANLRAYMHNTTDLIGGPYYNETTGFNNLLGYGRVNANTGVNGVGKAEIQVLFNGSTNIADNTGIVDFGAVAIGAPQTRLIRIRNQGTQDLNLSGLSLGAGAFSIVNGFGSSTLKIGQSTTFSVQFDPSATGQVNQPLNFICNDMDEDAFNFTLRGTGINPAISGTVYNDLDGNGSMNGADTAISGRAVFLDSNNNSMQDTKVFTNSTSVSIPDNNGTGAKSSVTVSDVGVVTGIKVTVNITHTYVGELTLSLSGPTGKSVNLAVNRGGSGNNYSGTTFADTATNFVQTASAPFSGTFKPENPLSGFMGLTGDGTWSLKVVDAGAGDTGTISSWTLTLSETSVTSDAAGKYQFSTLSTGNYRVRQALPANWTETQPTGGQGYAINYISGQSYPGRDFGSVFGNGQPLSVTVDQAVGQADPTNGSTINFTAVFNNPVSDFDSSDVVIGGTAGATTAIVTGAGTTYNIAISGMTTTGTVSVTIPAGVANAGGFSNTASTSTDNTVSFDNGLPMAAPGTISDVTVGGATEYQFTVVFSDDQAIDVSTIESGDVMVTNFLLSYSAAATLVGLDLNTNGTPRTATFGIVPPGGSWNAADNGDYNIILEEGKFADAAGNLSPFTFIGSFAVDVSNATKVASYQVNDGTAQRSRVTSLSVTFDSPVTLPANPAEAFELKRQSDNQLVNLDANVAGNTVTLTFTGGPLDFGSLADGRYTLTVLSSKIPTLDGNGDGTPGDDYVLVGTPANGLFRLFGDADGNGTVNTADFNAFRSAFGGSSSTFDFDNVGGVGTLDFNQFRQRFGSSV